MEQSILTLGAVGLLGYAAFSLLKRTRKAELVSTDDFWKKTYNQGGRRHKTRRRKN